jgi:hypothetical protein
MVSSDLRPKLNPIEKVWSTLKRSLANLTRTATALERTVKNSLKRMQYRNGLIDGYFAATGLSPPKPVGSHGSGLSAAQGLRHGQSGDGGSRSPGVRMGSPSPSGCRSSSRFVTVASSLVRWPLMRCRPSRDG